MNALNTPEVQALALSAPQAGLMTQASDNDQYLTFMLDGDVFAIGIRGIKEIIEYGSLTPVPTMPAAVRGVINLRGAVVPVVDLAVRIGKPASAVSRRTCIVIVEADNGCERHDVGVIVDAVNEVLDIPASEIEPVPAFGARIRRSFIRGMGKVAGRFVILLNVDKVLSLDDVGSNAALPGDEPAVLEMEPAP